jgi:hypothetical protein
MRGETKARCNLGGRFVMPFAVDQNTDAAGVGPMTEPTDIRMW